MPTLGGEEHGANVADGFGRADDVDGDGDEAGDDFEAGRPRVSAGGAAGGAGGRTRERGGEAQVEVGDHHEHDRRR